MSEKFKNIEKIEETHFGFKTVHKKQKVSFVRDVFDSVATNYDLMNDLMSGGIHRLWKAIFLDILRPRSDMRLLDVGGGTGDIACGFLDRGGGHVDVCDINIQMLSCGRDRAINQGYLKNLNWICGNAESLPFQDSSVDAYTIAFCIRNVTHMSQALKEAYRVLKPGGRFLCLEFSQVVIPILDKLYDTYSFTILPHIGRMVTGNKEAYQYLVESIRRFPNQETFANMIIQSGLEIVKVRNLTGGIAAIHTAWRL